MVHLQHVSQEPGGGAVFSPHTGSFYLDPKWLLHTCGKHAPSNYRHRGDAPDFGTVLKGRLKCPAILTASNPSPAYVNCVRLQRDDIYTVEIKGK